MCSAIDANVSDPSDAAGPKVLKLSTGVSIEFSEVLDITSANRASRSRRCEPVAL